ncbi:MAG: hypothetical protein ACQEQM_06875 [Thermoplasmatota archaeon]
MNKLRNKLEKTYPFILGAGYFAVAFLLTFQFRAGVYQAYPEAIVLFSFFPIITILPLLYRKKSELGRKLKYYGLALNVINAIALLIFFSIIG